MKMYYFIFIFFIVFIFIKFPIKLRVYFANNELYIYFYKFLLFSNVAKGEISKNDEKKIKKFLIKRDLAIKKLINIKNKINIKIDFKYDFGVNDAAYTAVLYGVLSIISSALYILTSKFFNIRKYEVNFIPYFNKTISIINFNCIINISIANIINILFIILTSIEKNEKFKEANYG